MSAPPRPRRSALVLTDAERAGLEALTSRHSTPQQLALRARIILAAAAGLGDTAIARQLQIARETVRLWRGRWHTCQEVSLEEQSVAARLTDLPRPGAPCRITPEQWCQITALVCEIPEDSDRPISDWSQREIAEEAIHRGLIDQISPRHLGRFLKGSRPPAPPQPLLADPRPAGPRRRARCAD